MYLIKEYLGKQFVGYTPILEFDEARKLAMSIAEKTFKNGNLTRVTVTEIQLDLTGEFYKEHILYADNVDPTVYRVPSNKYQGD